MESNTPNEKITLSLEPEETNNQAFDIGKPPRLDTYQMPEAKKQFTAGLADESTLSDEERQMVADFSKEINLSDTRQVLAYGSAAQRNISDFSVTILNKVQTRDLGEVGDTLKELTVALNATTEPERRGLLAMIFRRTKDSIEGIKANYAKAEENVAKIEQDLERHQVVLTQDISMFDQMYELNLKYYKELTMYIIAGKKALDKAKTEDLVRLKQIAEQTNAREDIQAYNDFKGMCNRFEKKLHDLELTRMISMQSAPQIRMIQNNDAEMLEKIQSSMINTIPLWRNQLVITLGIEHSKRALAAQKAITETTNYLLSSNAERLKQATVEIAAENERSIVDIDTLKKCNQELIFSINEVIKIHEEGTKARAQAQVELVKIEQELKKALLDTVTRK